MQQKHAYYPYFNISEASSKLEDSHIEGQSLVERKSSVDSNDKRQSQGQKEMKEWVTKKSERRPKSPRVQSSMVFSLNK